MHIDRPIAIAIILFAVLLLLFFLVVPAYSEYKMIEMDLAQKKAEFNAQYDYYADINKTYTLLQSQSENVRKIDNALPTQTDLGQLVYYFQKTTKNNGLLLKNLVLSQSSASDKNDLTGVKDLVFSLDLFGSYASLKNFIVALESSDRLFEISIISFGSSAQEIGAVGKSTATSKLGVFSFNLQVKTHSY